jgi:signal transduction histidine kinase
MVTGKAAAARSARVALTSAELRELFEGAGLSLAGPAAVFDAAGSLIWFNARFGELLGLRLRDRPTELRAESGAARWPFFDEHHSSRALFRQLVLEPLAAAGWDAPAEAGLRTYRVRARAVVARRRRLRLVSALSLRKGDLLSDRPSRQALFRTLSHEIRTSLASLKGYLGMLQDGVPRERGREIRERMDHSLKRLDEVVRRLDEFKAELGVEI